MLEELEDKNVDTTRKKIKWNTEKIMSASALFISVISVIALIYQSYLGREENVLIQKQQSAAVLPHLNQWQSEYDNTYKFVVGNKGVGPAFIESVAVTLNSSKTFNNTDDLFRKIFNSSKKLDTMSYTVSTLVKGFVLSPNEQINVLEVKGSKNIDIFKDVIRNFEIDYKIIYKDVYGSKWMLTNENVKESSASIPVAIEK